MRHDVYSFEMVYTTTKWSACIGSWLTCVCLCLSYDVYNFEVAYTTTKWSACVGSWFVYTWQGVYVYVTWRIWFDMAYTTTKGSARTVLWLAHMSHSSRHVYTYIYAYIPIHIYIYVYVYIYTYIHIYTGMYAWIYVYIYACLYTHIHIENSQTWTWGTARIRVHNNLSFFPSLNTRQKLSRPWHVWISVYIQICANAYIMIKRLYDFMQLLSPPVSLCMILFRSCHLCT